MKRIEEMTATELVMYGKAAVELRDTIRGWMKSKHWPADKHRQYFLTKCVAELPQLEMAIDKARELYRTKFK